MIPSIVETCHLTRLEGAAHPLNAALVRRSPFNAAQGAAHAFDGDSSGPDWRRRRERRDTFPDDGRFQIRTARGVHEKAEGASYGERLRGRYLVTILREGMKLRPAHAGTTLRAYGSNGKAG